MRSKSSKNKTNLVSDPYLKLRCDDSIVRLRKIPDHTFHSLVSDPPSGILAVGTKTKWDDDKGGRNQWIAWLRDIMTEAHRTLCPGSYGVIWSLPRTQHWTMTALEDAGFEIVDVVVHLFGRSLVKGQDASKAIDNYLGLPRRVVGTNKNYRKANTHGSGLVYNANKNDTESILSVSKAWEGWRSTLKPATESWILVRKPLDGNVAENILKYDVGAVKIGKKNVDKIQNNMVLTHHRKCQPNICDTRCVVYGLAEQNQRAVSYFKTLRPETTSFIMDDKISGKERKSDDNTHPTPKSLALMKFMVGLVTPKGGKVLDPFMGSGSTGVAALQLGCGFYGIEKEEQYFEIAKRRLEKVLAKTVNKH